MDTVDTAKDEMGWVERVLSKVPGLKGYKEKELRREADKSVRDSLARRLEARRRKITALQSELLSSGGLLWMDDVEKVVGRLQLLIDRIKTASYGYAPLFDSEKVKEEQLDKLVQFDESLLSEVTRLDEAISTLEQAVAANENVKQAIAGVGDLLSALNETFGRREEAIRGE
ncbi:MAG: hypothetical protein CVU38_13955 [Chloroflexi bacterium HGW-Chloroflexi-1]|nr:MAG: hypothetical protein CVU38_13955 [Chloroflexi bacterium HGW-Chloroflexi-1]